MPLVKKRTKSQKSYTNRLFTINNHSTPDNIKPYYKTIYKIPNKIKSDTCITYTTSPSLKKLSLLNSRTPLFSHKQFYYRLCSSIHSSPIPNSLRSSSFYSSDIPTTNVTKEAFKLHSPLSNNYTYSPKSRFKYKYIYNLRYNYNFKYPNNNKNLPFRKKEHVKIFPQVFIEGYYLCIDYIKVNLKKYPTTLKLVKAFFNNQTITELTRESLIKHVYEEAKYNGTSKREECLSGNLIKLISRTRNLIKDAMEEEYKYIDWLYYDSTNKKWGLYTLQKEYLDIKESKFKNLIFNINTLNYYHNINNII